MVADGNFKADHVKQKKDNDVWLMDGGGMVPNQDEYSAFLKKAIDIPMVSWFHCNPSPAWSDPNPDVDPITFLFY